MVSNSDDSRSDDRENLPLESLIFLQSFSEDLAHMTQSLQTLRELRQLVRTCSDFLVEDGSSHKLSGRHLYLLVDMYMCYSEIFWDEIQPKVSLWQRIVEKSGDKDKF